MRSLLFFIALLSFIPTIWNKPFWGVTLYAVFNIVRPEMFFWGGSAGARTFQILAGSTILATMTKHSSEFSKFRLADHTNLWLYLWIYIAFLFSSLISPYSPEFSGLAQTQYGFLNELLKNFIFYCLVTMYVKELKDVFKIETILVIAVSCLSLWGIEQYFGGNARLEGIGGNSYMDSNGVAAIFVLFTPVALSYFFSSNKWSKLFGLTTSGIIVIAIICTSSRGGFLGLSVALLVLILKTKKKLQFILLGFLVSMALSPFLTKDYTDRIGGMRDTEKIDYSGQSRFVLWKTGLMIFADNPIFGVGFLSFKDAKMEYKYVLNIEESLREYTFGRNKVGHSTYVQILAEGGLLTAIPYFSLIIFTIFNNWKIRKKLSKNKSMAKVDNLLIGMDSGIIGFAVCIIAIDAVIDVMFPLQITICAILRGIITNEQILNQKEIS